mgnify:FL=1
MGRFDGRGDSCLSIFAEVYATGALVFPSRARVLEIGCAEADWVKPMLAERSDLQITGIDWRECERSCEVIRGDVLTHDFPPRSFDVAVGISSIEHIGLGHYNCDPLDMDGDRHCMERVARWLKPGGWVYADVPCGPEYRVEGTSHRVYDYAALLSRLVVPGLWLKRRWFSDEDGTTLWDAPQPPGARMQYVAVLLRKE